MSRIAYRNCRIALIDAGQESRDTVHALVIGADGVIAWMGDDRNIPSEMAVSERVDLGGRLVTPALIDCHTHLVHGGNRASEFEMRLQGASYEQISRAGGGIMSTVKATRGRSVEQLVTEALPRLDAMLAEGVSTVEIKSGYGLNIETEINMLRAARRLGEIRQVRVVTTWLAAHALPPEYADRADAYIYDVAITGLCQAHAQGLVDAVDGFCESIAFDRDQIARVFDAARAMGLPIRLHAEQLGNNRGAEMAAQMGAASVDHLEYLDDRGIAALARARTVAVLLPGAYYTLRETQAPPVDALRRARVPIAIASDANPGSSPLTSPLLTMNMACTLFGLTPAEALAGMTVNAARALGLRDRGLLQVGMRGDLAVWDVEHPAELAYRMGFNPLWKRIIGGHA